MARPLSHFFTLSSTDLLRDPVYRRLWLSILISSFGQQVTMLAVPLTAALLLHASPSQMGLLTAMELAPFVLFSLPVGVWLDRVRKLPVYIAGEIAVALVLASIPAAWALGWLSMPYLYGAGFLMGCVFVSSGTAAQIVLTQVVPRERLVEAHAKNALATSGAEVIGPGFAGILIKLVGAPLALLADALLLMFSVSFLRGLRARETPLPLVVRDFRADLKEGLRFVWHHPLLPRMALMVGLWQLCHHASMVVQILFAIRVLGLTEQQVGLCYIAMGVGTVLASTLGHRISVAIGPGSCLTLGVLINGLGWLQLALVPPGPFALASYVLMLMCFSIGAVLLFINFLALRQAVTPAPLLARMTSTMRWLILIPAGPGALLGGYVGEHFGLRFAMALGGVGALLLAWMMWRSKVLRTLHPHGLV
jgi:predicted MFS family arabinose efflux permease